MVIEINHAVFTVISCLGISKLTTAVELASRHCTHKPHSLRLILSLTQKSPRELAQPPMAEVRLTGSVGL